MHSQVRPPLIREAMMKEFAVTVIVVVVVVAIVIMADWFGN